MALSAVAFNCPLAVFAVTFTKAKIAKFSQNCPLFKHLFIISWVFGVFQEFDYFLNLRVIYSYLNKCCKKVVIVCKPGIPVRTSGIFTMLINSGWGGIPSRWWWPALQIKPAHSSRMDSKPADPTHLTGSNWTGNSSLKFGHQWHYKLNVVRLEQVICQFCKYTKMFVLLLAISLLVHQVGACIGLGGGGCCSSSQCAPQAPRCPS